MTTATTSRHSVHLIDYCVGHELGGGVVGVS